MTKLDNFAGNNSLGILDEAISQAQYLLDVAYKQAVHDIGITDWSKATPEDKRRVDILRCVIFKTMNNNVNQIRIADELHHLTGIRNALNRGNLT